MVGLYNNLYNLTRSHLVYTLFALGIKLDGHLYEHEPLTY